MAKIRAVLKLLVLTVTETVKGPIEASVRRTCVDSVAGYSDKENIYK